MNRINQKLQEDKKLLSIYFSAGYPNLNDTIPIIERLEKSGVDMIEIGLPFSDPLADGPTIQKSSTKALKNGISTELLFEQLNHAKDSRGEGEARGSFRANLSQLISVTYFLNYSRR